MVRVDELKNIFLIQIFYHHSALFRHVGSIYIPIPIHVVRERGFQRGEVVHKLCVENSFPPKNLISISLRKLFSMRNFKHLSTLVAPFGYFPLLMTESNVKKKTPFLFGGSLWVLSVAGDGKYRKQKKQKQIFQSFL